jgi:hypothetical protein
MLNWWRSSGCRDLPAFVVEERPSDGRHRAKQSTQSIRSIRPTFTDSGRLTTGKNVRFDESNLALAQDRLMRVILALMGPPHHLCRMNGAEKLNEIWRCRLPTNMFSPPERSR